MLIPVGVQGHGLRRIPWVSITIAGLCVLLFLVTWVLPAEPLSDGTLLRRLALIPQRGVAQPGWLTYMFLHLGWFHLIGNLLFFYLTALLLEDTWGRPLFAGFYLAGGLAGAIAHYAADPHSASVMAGASGAIAACMGAFAFRYATTKVRIGYLFFVGFKILRGTFLVPAWLAAGAWGAFELLKLLLGGEPGVAVAAHVGGFLFGLGAAVAIKTGGIERKFVEPGLEESAVAWERPESLDRAHDAFARGDLPGARRHAVETLKTHPEDPEAELLLYRIDAAQGRTAAASGRLDRLVERYLQSGDTDALYTLVTSETQKVAPDALRPITALRVAEALEGYQGLQSAELAALYDVASRAEGFAGAKARIRQAELALDDRQLAQARERVATLEGPELPPEWASRLEVLQRRLATAPPATLAERRAEAGGAVTAPPPRIVSGVVVGATGEALQIRSAGGQVANLAWARIVAVAAALTPVEVAGAARLVPVTDLVLGWGSADQGAQVLRLDAQGLGLGTLFPGVPPKEAWARWLKDVAQRSGATVLPDAQTIARGEYPRYPSLEAMTAALYQSDSLF